jgi:beta-phosphoglucomutase
VAKTKALIFDLDGVLANTIDLHYRAWKHLADQHRIPFSPADVDRFRGIQRHDFVIELFAPAHLTPAQVEAYADLKNAIYVEALRQTPADALLVPNARDLITQAQRAGLRVGVASSSTNAISTLIHTDLYDLIDVVADGNTVTRSKPEPDIFLWTAGALRVHPREVIVFEDAAAGVAAACTAGMFAVGIGRRDLLRRAHLVCPDLQTIQLDTVLAAANQEPQTSPASRETSMEY